MQRARTVNTLRFARITAAVLFAVYASLLATRSPQGFPAGPSVRSFWPWLADKPLNEDGFYMLTVADNFATGHGLAYNYGPPVTGIQPLSTLVFAAFSYVVHHCGGDRWTLVRVVLLFGACTHLLFAWLMARFSAGLLPHSSDGAQRALVRTLAFFLLLCDLTLFRLQSCGLETGIYLCLLAMCITLWQRMVTLPATGVFAMFGVIGGCAGLARIDFGIVYAFLLLYLIFKRIGAPWQALLSGSLALLIVSPWFLYVRYVTGDWMPTSGAVESGFAHQGADRIVAWSLATLSHVVPWSYAAIRHPETTALGLVSLAALLWLLRSANQIWATLATPAVRDTLLPWSVAMAALSVVYAVTFQSTFFYVRYFAPMLLVTVPAIALLVGERKTVQSRLLLPLVTVVVLFCAQIFNTLHRGGFGNPHFLPAGYIVRTFPGVRIGAYQSGVIGYLDLDVENLDGKLNAAAHRATETHTLDAFIDREGINILIDWPTYLDNTLPAAYLQRNWQPCPHAVNGGKDVCFIRKSFLAIHPDYR